MSTECKACHTRYNKASAIAGSQCPVCRGTIENVAVVSREEVETAIAASINEENPYYPYLVDDPADINEGMCEEFAMSIQAYLDFPGNLSLDCGGEDRPELGGHVWLKLEVSDGEYVYFDSESPEGVDDPHRLEFFRRN